MENIKELRTRFLNDTVEFYSADPVRLRATVPRPLPKVPDFMGCVYSPTSSSPGCAIGRHIEDKTLCKKWDEKSVPVQFIFDDLPINLKELGKHFLRLVQALHDNKENWNEAGLTELGKNKIDNIKTLIENDSFHPDNGQYDYTK